MMSTSILKPRDSTSILKALSCKLDIKRHSPGILYISASLAMSTSILKALAGILDIKRHSYLGSLAMSTSILKALPGKLDIKIHSPGILYISMSTSILKVLPGKLDIKRHSTVIFYISAASRCQQAFSKPLLPGKILLIYTRKNSFHAFSSFCVKSIFFLFFKFKHVFRLLKRTVTLCTHNICFG